MKQIIVERSRIGVLDMKQIIVGSSLFFNGPYEVRIRVIRDPTLNTEWKIKQISYFLIYIVVEMILAQKRDRESHE